LSAYFTKFLNYTIGDQLWQRLEDDKYNDSKRHNDLLFIYQRYANWGPEDNVQGFGFIQEDCVQVIKNDYDLHQNPDQTSHRSLLTGQLSWTLDANSTAETSTITIGSKNTRDWFNDLFYDK
jgi:hypothetical protein